MLVGGGAIALFKYNKIIDYQPAKLTVVSKKYNDEFKKDIPAFVEQLERPFSMNDLDSADIVVVAVDDLELQKEIYVECQSRKIPCNCVDEINRCDFIFPSTIKKGDVVIAISSSGKVPGFSVSLKDYINTFLPENIEQKMNEIMELRKSLPAGKDRMLKIKEESAKYFDHILSGIRK